MGDRNICTEILFTNTILLVRILADTILLVRILAGISVEKYGAKFLYVCTRLQSSFFVRH